LVPFLPATHTTPTHPDATLGGKRRSEQVPPSCSATPSAQKLAPDQVLYYRHDRRADSSLLNLWSSTQIAPFIFTGQPREFALLNGAPQEFQPINGVVRMFVPVMP
jgi:hypothetical protein